MGYEIARFIHNNIDDELLCSICSLVMDKPLETPCEHTFCGVCIKEWITVNDHCPIDQTFLTFDELKQTPRYFCNILDKMEIRCDFGKTKQKSNRYFLVHEQHILSSEPKGCQTVVPLGNLQHHVNSCKHHPNYEVTCNKGCNMKMTRSESENHNCILRQQEEIANLKVKLSRQQGKILDFEEKIRNMSLVLYWQINVNMKISSTCKTNVLENAGKSSRALAQLSYQLKPEKPYFHVLILEISSFDVIEVALANKRYITDFGTLLDNRTVSYNSDGKGLIDYNKTRNDLSNQISSYWEKGDVIKCEVNFGEDISKFEDAYRYVEISFFKNQKFVAKEMVCDLWRNSLFPTIDILTSTDSTAAHSPKVLYLDI